MSIVLRRSQAAQLASRIITLRGEMGFECFPDLEMPEQESTFIEAFPPQPTGDLVIAFAGIAGATCGDDVVQGIASSTGQCQYAVAL